VEDVGVQDREALEGQVMIFKWELLLLLKKQPLDLKKQFLLIYMLSFSLEII